MKPQKHDYGNCNQFAPNFDMAYDTIQRVFVPSLNLFGPTKTELWAKKVGKFSIMLYGKWASGHLFAHQHRCRNINIWRFSIT